MLDSRWNNFIGIATECNKLTSPAILHVFCPELMPMVTGQLCEQDPNDPGTGEKAIYRQLDSKVEIAVRNLDASITKKKLSCVNSLECTYYGRTNAIIPDIVPGEQVEIWHYAKLDKYYWRELGRNNNLRNTELVRFFINSKKLTQQALTDDNTYFMEWNSRTKQIIFSTSAVNDEVCRYFGQINTAAGVLTFKDDKGNSLTVDSINGIWTVISNNAINVIAKKNIAITAEGLLTITAPGGTTVNGPMTINGDVSMQANLTVKGTTTTTKVAPGSCTIK